MRKNRPFASPPVQLVTEPPQFTSVGQSPLPLAFLLAWLMSAAVVLVSRFFNAADLGYDLTAQFQAAQNLLAGRGLTTYLPTTGDIADALTLQTLTHFPSGFSLCAAALMALGATPGTALKILSAAATMLGWWGWARLAFAYMEEGWRSGGLWRGVAIAIAILTPLLFTPSWSGTDIILWAALPWVLMLVVRSQARQTGGWLRLDAIAGALTGACVLMRYASLFLAGFVFLAIACQCRLRPALSFRRVIAFAAGFLPFVAVQSYVNFILASQPATPGGVALNSGILSTLERGWDGLFHVSMINAPVFFWLSERRIEWVMDGPYQLLGLALTAVVFLSPVILAVAKHGRLTSEMWHDVRVVAAGVFVFLPVFLLLCETLGMYDYALDSRYYLPLVPLAVFVAYSIAQGHFRSPSLSAVVRLTAHGYLAAFLMVTTVNVVLLVMPGARGQFRRTMLLGTSELHSWPSTRVSYEFSPARDYVLSAMKAAPDALLLTNLPHWFWADPAVDSSRILPLEPCNRPWIGRVTGPAHLIIFAADRGGPLQELYWFESLAEPTRADCFERLPPFDLVRRFPDEGLKLLRVEIPEGMSVALKDSTASPAGLRESR